MKTSNRRILRANKGGEYVRTQNRTLRRGVDDKGRGFQARKTLIINVNIRRRRRVIETLPHHRLVTRRHIVRVRTLTLFTTHMISTVIHTRHISHAARLINTCKHLKVRIRISTVQRAHRLHHRHQHTRISMHHLSKHRVNQEHHDRTPGHLIRHRRLNRGRIVPLTSQQHARQ